MKDNIVRESPDDKVKDLLEWMESIRKNIRHKVLHFFKQILILYKYFNDFIDN